MPSFPSIEWCRALVEELAKDPAVLVPLREWNGRSLGVVIGKGEGLAKDFCVFARPHATEPRLERLELCEDEDDLGVEEPDYLFRAPISVVKSVMERRLDPLDVLRKGQVKVEGDLQFLVSYGTKHKGVGESAVARVIARK